MKKTGVFMALVIATGLLAASGFFGSARPAAAHPARQSGDLVAASLAFADAFNAKDPAKMKQLADPAFVEVAGTGEKMTLDQFAASTSAGIHVALSNCRLTSPNGVSCDTILSGGPLPVLPHPWTETSLLTFANGKILRLDETLSTQTAHDLQALPPANPAPGMPTTGSADPGLSLLLLVLGVLIVAAGTVIRRVYTLA